MFKAIRSYHVKQYETLGVFDTEAELLDFLKTFETGFFHNQEEADNRVALAQRWLSGYVNEHSQILPEYLEIEGGMEECWDYLVNLGIERISDKGETKDA